MSPAESPRRSISLVIPAFNEELRLPPTLATVDAWLSERAWEAEILVVDDGSRDATAELTEAWARRGKIPVRLLRQETNRGKGAAVRRGVSEARREVVLFSDADLSTPMEEAERLLAELERGADVAIGTRASRESRIEIHQPRYREWLGKSGNHLVRLLTGMPFHDTQCGFKAFRTTVARDIFSRMKVDGFGFDIEALYLALKLGYRVHEVPVVWRNAAGSRVDPVRDALRVLRDLLLIRWRGLTGGYSRLPRQAPPRSER